MAVSKCPLSVLERCPSYREFGYSKMTEKWQGPSSGVRLMEVSVKRELTVIPKLLHQLKKSRRTFWVLDKIIFERNFIACLMDWKLRRWCIYYKLMPASHMEVGCQETWGLELPTSNPGSKNTPKACPSHNPTTPPAVPKDLRADPARSDGGSWPISHSPQGTKPEAPNPKRAKKAPNVKTPTSYASWPETWIREYADVRI